MENAGIEPATTVGVLTTKPFPCIVLDKGWIQSEKLLFFQTPSDLDIFLVLQHQSMGNNNCCRKQLEHSIHMTAQTNMLEGSHHNPFSWFGNRLYIPIYSTNASKK